MITEKELIPLKFDLVFKRVFGDKNDLQPIRCLLKRILNIEPKEINILNSEIIGKPYKDKNVNVDLIVTLEDNTHIMIEINTDVNSALIDRNFFYLCRVISNNLKPNISYNELNKHIQINFDFRGLHKKPIMHYKITSQETGETLTDKLEIVRIDVPYFSSKWYNTGKKGLTESERFIALFNISDKEIAKDISNGDKDMGEILKKIEECSSDEEIIGAYDAEFHRSEIERLGKMYAKEEGIKEGIKEGILKKSKEIARKMIEKNMDINTISEITGLTKEQIKELS